MNPIDVARVSDATVLITGPTGSGKSRLAREIHERSARRAGPFVTVNLASVHQGTLESELFGHEKGAFTGAAARKAGRLASAAGGTVFLDEVGELPPQLQARLLEFLQSRTVTPIGAARSGRVDARVIAATHRDLLACVRSGAFREDLFHRLNVVSVEIPPLARRFDELDGFIHSCLGEISREIGKPVHRISEEVADAFERYDWPGNLRELRNVIEYAVHSSSGREIRIENLPGWLRSALSRAGAEPSVAVLGVAEIPLTLDYRQARLRFEREFLSRALERFDGRINLTARRTGIHKTTLIRRIRKCGLVNGFNWIGDSGKSPEIGRNLPKKVLRPIRTEATNSPLPADSNANDSTAHRGRSGCCRPDL